LLFWFVLSVVVVAPGVVPVDAVCFGGCVFAVIRRACGPLFVLVLLRVAGVVFVLACAVVVVVFFGDAVFDFAGREGEGLGVALAVDGLFVAGAVVVVFVLVVLAAAVVVFLLSGVADAVGVGLEAASRRAACSSPS
jgi:hypothetical protein